MNKLDGVTQTSHIYIASFEKRPMCNSLGLLTSLHQITTHTNFEEENSDRRSGKQGKLA